MDDGILCYVNKIHDEKLVRSVQVLYHVDIQIGDFDIVPFPDIFGLVPWGHHLDIIRLTDTLPEAIFYIKQTILICSAMKQTEVRYSFKGLSTPIGVATYDNVQIANIERELPSVEQLQQKIKQLEMQLNERK